MLAHSLSAEDQTLPPPLPFQTATRTPKHLQIASSSPPVLPTPLLPRRQMPQPTPLSRTPSDTSLPAYIDRLRQYVQARLGPEYFASCAWRDYKLKLAQDAPGAPEDLLDSLKPFWMDRVLIEKGISPADEAERSWLRLTGGWLEAATLR